MPINMNRLEYSAYQREGDMPEHCDQVCAGSAFTDPTRRHVDDRVQECVRQLCAASYQGLVQHQPPTTLPSSCPSSCSEFNAFCAASSYAANCLADDGVARRWVPNAAPSSDEHPWMTSFPTRMWSPSRNDQSRGTEVLTKRGYGDMMDVCLEYHCGEKLNGAVENVIRCAIENHCTTL